MATATFDDILAAQRETNQILGKQKSPLDGRTGAGKALLDASKEQLDRQSETTDAIHELHVATAGHMDDSNKIKPSTEGKGDPESQQEESDKDKKSEQDNRF